MEIRPLDPVADFAAVARIFREVGWIESDEHEAAFRHFIVGTDGWVTDIDGEPECAVLITPGSLRYQATDLALAIVSGVTTSLIGRKQGLATRLTAHAVSQAAAGGAAVSILGMFEQGFYNLVGFGSGSYEHHLRFDPASLQVDVPYRRPVRLAVDDWEEIHAAMAQRHLHHGGVVAHPSGYTRGEISWTDKPFGLGYRSDDGELTHFIWGTTKGGFGPYRVTSLAYRTPGQLLELLKVVASLGDQVRSIEITEPAGIQLQDLLGHVVRQEVATARSEHEFRHSSGTWWQVRMLDVAACFAARSYGGHSVRFVAELTDPIEQYLEGGPWYGTGGSYVVTIGEESSAEPGSAPDLPVLRASVNALSRAWLGVRAPTSLAVTDDLAGPAELLAELDEALALPRPYPGMFF